ncbi:MAG: amidohydrolase, partial [Brevundimonas sp.]|nr:amidohydrolase [Brevundimonas sp.]
MTIRRLLAVSTLSLALSAGLAHAQTAPIALERIEAAVTAGTPQVVAWRRDLHANPELGFAETRTAALVAEHLRTLGME